VNNETPLTWSSIWLEVRPQGPVGTAGTGSVSVDIARSCERVSAAPNDRQLRSCTNDLFVVERHRPADQDTEGDQKDAVDECEH
jgi:hypothetical protein